MEILLEKATFTGHELHKKINKLFYMEIPLEKATFTGHELQKKINKLFYMEIPLEKATFTGHELQKKINKLFYMENPLEKATFTGHEYHKHGGRRSIAGTAQHSIKPLLKEILFRNPFKIFLSASIFKRNLFKNFFHIIFFTGKSFVKNLKITFNFT